MNKRFGFTLAEVLITLGIIGVVAAMTIPTLMNQTGSTEYKSGLKKALSVLNQAITINVAIDGTDFSSMVAGNADNAETVLSLFTTRMSYIKTSEDQDTDLGTAFGANNYTVYLNDGMIVTFPQAAASCVLTTPVTMVNCRMVVDVNGVKRPNKLSEATEKEPDKNIYDQFVFDFYNQQVMPHNDAARFVLYD